MNRAAESNADLSALTKTAGTLAPDFDSGVTSYTLTLDKDTAGTTITAVKASALATVKVGDEVKDTVTVTLANGGTQTVAFEVTAQDGVTKKTYSVTVNRAAENNADLSALTKTAGTLAPDFDSGVTSYTLTLDKDTASTTITAVKASGLSTLTVDGEAGGSKTVTLANGASQTVTIMVTAQDGTVKEYTVFVTRDQDNNNTLASLSATAGTLTPAFSVGVTGYTIVLDKATASTTITATKASDLATLKVDGAAGNSKTVTLANGASKTVIFTVIAQNGTQQDYTVQVTRAEYGTIRFLCKDNSGHPYAGIGLKVYLEAALIHQAGSGTADSNGVITVTGLDTATYWVKVTSVPAGYELPDVKLPVSAQDGKVTDYTLIIPKTAVLSLTSTQLKKLTVSAGTISPAFSPAKLKYTITLNENTSQTTLTPALADTTSKLYIDGKLAASKTVSLIPGAKATVKIKVLSRAGESEIYTVDVVRAKSTNAYLASLTTSRGTLSPAFDKSKAAFTLKLANTQTSTVITPKLSSTYAKYTMTLNGKRTTSRTVSLKLGETKTLVITVTAQAGNTRTYKIVISRPKSTIADLSSLTASRGTLSPKFNKAATSYTIKLSKTQTSTTVSLKLAEKYAKYALTLDGRRTTSRTVSLIPGQTKTMIITVTAQAGNKKTYKIVVTRDKSDNADLSGITVSKGKLQPRFNKATLSYKLNLDKKTGSVTITPKVYDKYAKYTINVDGKAATSKVVALAPGETKTVVITVTAQNGRTKAYTITVSRAK